jgi:hypothetical protein
MAVAQPLSIEGDWTDDHPALVNNIVTFRQEGNRITAHGSFTFNGFRCEWVGTGTLNGDRLEHTINYTRRPPDAAWRGADGRVVLTLSADGRSLTGTWYNNNGDSGPKRLNRRGGAFAGGYAAPAPAYSVEGDWTDDHPALVNNIVTFRQEGNRITARGSFTFNGFRCEWVGTGTLNGNRLEHTINYTRRPPDAAWRGADGRVVLTLSPDGRSLTGTWYNNNGDSGPKRLYR